MKKIFYFFIIIIFVSCTFGPKSNKILNNSKKKYYLSNNPKINQLGYFPESRKIFTIIANTAKKDDIFQIYTKDKILVYQSNITSNEIDDIKSTGEKVRNIDFSNFKNPGEYYIEINGNRSFNFKIKNNIYNKLFIDSSRCLYLIRCGIKINDNTTGIYHEKCHINDAERVDNKHQEDFSGGWHNAGDFGKWTHTTAMTVTNLLWLYEIKKSKINNITLNIPKSSNSIPDILDEAKWGLDWLLKMQNSDGSVFHKIDTQPNFSWGKAPENDLHKRYARFGTLNTQIPSTIDAADFTAVMCQAYRVYKDIDTSFAEKCKNAAIKTMKYIENNKMIEQNDIYYPDNDYRQELLWANAEYYRLTGDIKYFIHFNKISNEIALWYPNCVDTQIYGYFTLTQDTKCSLDIKNNIINKITNTADYYITQSNKTGYKVALYNYEYYWGSNQETAGKGIVLLLAHNLTNDKSYLDCAISQLDYLLGNNSLNFSFVTGYGYNSPKSPYHWTFYVYDKIIPGWLTGGANSQVNANDPLLTKLVKKGTPPAKCYVDLCSNSGSWGSSEGTIDGLSSLIFLTGYFYK